MHKWVNILSCVADALLLCFNTLYTSDSVLWQTVKTQMECRMANSEDPDEMSHPAAFHQGLHCLL